MKFLLVFLAAALFGQSADEAQVREVVRKYTDARDHVVNQGDAKTLEALFTPDADQLVSSGVWRKGREEVVRGSIASSQSETGKRTITVESVRFLAPTVALADARYELGDRKMWTTILLARDKTGWHITAIRNMLPAK
jgi:uncharacterized protein (TIGR02246 family)